jgi:hypothetical protein
MGKRLTGAGALVLILAVLGYAYASPYITVTRVRSAAERGDADIVNDHVDFPALRESIKGSFNTLLAKHMATDEARRDNPFSLLGMVLASKFADVMVDSMVTPEAVRAMMRGQRPQPASPERGRSGTRPEKPSDVETSMRYETWNRFAVTSVSRTNPDDKFTMVWRRHGLTWKLSALRIPMPE